MKFVRTLQCAAALAFVAAGAQAQTTDLNARMAASGNLVATPNPVSFTVRGGLSAFRVLQVTDTGAGFASNLNVTVTQLSGQMGYLSVNGDTCTGATLAPNGTCKLNLEFDGACPKGEVARWNITITSTTAPTIVIPVTGNSQAGICM